jgi:hypothetical protein
MAEAGITTTTTSLDIVAGDSFDIVYKVSCSASTICHISVNVTPNDQGFNFTYNKSVTIQSNQITTIIIHANTSVLLTPDQYNLTTSFESEDNILEPIIIKETKTVVKTVTRVEVRDVSVPPEIMTVYKNTTLPPQTIYITEIEPTPFWQFGLAFMTGVIISSISLLVYIKTRRIKQ